MLMAVTRTVPAGPGCPGAGPAPAAVTPPQPAPRLFAPGPGANGSPLGPPGPALHHSDEEAGWESSSSNDMVPVDNPDSSSAAINEERSRTRRLIKVDFSRLQDDDDEEANDSDHHHDGDGAESDGGAERTSGNASNPWHRTGSRRDPLDSEQLAQELALQAHEIEALKSLQAHEPGLREAYCDFALEPYDLATQCPSRRASMRRHTIMICEPVAQAAGPLSKSQPGSRPASRGSPRPAAEADVVSNTLGLQLPELSLSRSSLQEELFQSKQWKHDCLSLTLDEIVHIRSVLTKAELESLPVEGHVKEDAEKGKVCFLCMKTRFGIFGPWGQKCKLCKRTVCAKCHSKMRIPTEHFAHVPVVAISPSQLASPDDPADQKSHDAATFSRTLMSRLLQTDNPLRTSNSVGSAPSSPKLSRADTASVPNSAPGSGAASMAASMVGSMADSTEGPVSLPALSPESNSSDRRAKFNRSKTLGRPEKERLRGLEMIVCLDCKTMVLEIIKSSRTTRTNTIRNLTLNLSPVY